MKRKRRIEEEYIGLEEASERYVSLKRKMEDLEKIRVYVTNEDGTQREDVENISLEELGISSIMLEDKNDEEATLFDLLHSEELHGRWEPTWIPIASVIELPKSTLKKFHSSRYGNVDYIEQLVQCSEDDLIKRKISFKSIREIERALRSMRYELRREHHRFNSCMEDRRRENLRRMPIEDTIKMFLEAYDRKLETNQGELKKLGERIVHLFKFEPDFSGKTNITEPDEMANAVLEREERKRTPYKQDTEQDKQKRDFQFRRWVLMKTIKESQEELRKLEEEIKQSGIDIDSE